MGEELLEKYKAGERNFKGADLYHADLSGATLYRAKGIKPESFNPLMVLYDQVGKIRAYKLINDKNEGPIKGGIKYVVGETISVKDANTDPLSECAAGINVATLDWCLREYKKGYKILIVEFTRKDIATIPYASDGKFRLHRCRVVSEKDVSELLPTPNED